MWGVLDRRVQKRPEPPAMILALHQTLEEGWNATQKLRTTARIQIPMTGRICTGLAANEGHMPY